VKVLIIMHRLSNGEGGGKAQVEMGGLQPHVSKVQPEQIDLVVEVVLPLCNQGCTLLERTRGLGWVVTCQIEGWVDTSLVFKHLVRFQLKKSTGLGYTLLDKRAGLTALKNATAPFFG